MSSVNYRPKGYHTITPYLILNDAQALVDFISKAFDAKIGDLMRDDKGTIVHGEAFIGDSPIMFSTAQGDYKSNATMLHLYVKDVDATYQKALDAGAETVRELGDEFYGDRSAGVTDSNGMTWWLATHMEDLSEEEMARRHEEYMKQK